jgi:hypothetical protein
VRHKRILSGTALFPLEEEEEDNSLTRKTKVPLVTLKYSNQW